MMDFISELAVHNFSSGSFSWHLDFCEEPTTLKKQTHVLVLCWVRKYLQ